jgi:hypothetical protein
MLPKGINTPKAFMLFKRGKKTLTPNQIIESTNPVRIYKPEDLLGTGVATGWNNSATGGGANATVVGVAPTITPNALNGYSVATFAAVGGGFIVNHTPINQPNTIVVIMRQTSSQSIGWILDSVSARTLLRLTGGGVLDMFAGNIVSGSNSYLNAGYINITAIYDGANSFGYVNNILEINNQNTGTQNIGTSFYIGCRNTVAEALTGDIAQVIIYDRVLTAAERTLVFNALKNKFNL